MDELKWDKKFALGQAAKDEELLQELIELFKESSAADLAYLKQGIRKGDAAMGRAATLSLKGAATSLGLNGIGDLAAVMEEDCRAGSLQVATEKLPELEQLLSLLQEL